MDGSFDGVPGFLDFRVLAAVSVLVVVVVVVVVVALVPGLTAVLVVDEDSRDVCGRRESAVDSSTASSRQLAFAEQWT